MSAAPNVLLVMTDDVGFGAASAFGGLIPTPNLDKLRANGALYNRFHTTAMCSPTRAALLTGRNHHSAGQGALVEYATRDSGYSGITKSTATIADVLKENGYNTAFFGKHHNVPLGQASDSGPFDDWPTGLGFEYFYGFIGAETDQFNPVLVRGTSYVTPPANGEVLDKMMADDAIGWIRRQKADTPDKPFFVYYAPGTAHAPLQAPRAWIEKFKGKFDMGWDVLREQIFARQKKLGVIPQSAVLTPRSDIIPAWDSLTPSEKQFAARGMEVFAGMLAYQDEQFGRIVNELERTGQTDNTMVIFIEGDNGPEVAGGKLGNTNDFAGVFGVEETDEWRARNLEAMGGPNVRAHYPAGFAWAMGTPFQYWKKQAGYLGGTRNGMVIKWPKHVAQPETVRSQFSHVIDIMPTILEAAGIEMPMTVDGVAQKPVEGISLAYTLNSPKAPERHTTQYFELLGSRGIYHDGWWAAQEPVPTNEKHAGGAGPDDSRLQWRLYDLDHDYSQSRDVSAKYPARLAELKDLWTREAQTHSAFPINRDASMDRVFAALERARPTQSQYTYWGSGIRLREGSQPPIMTYSFRIKADMDLPERANGVVAALGDKFGGWSFLIKNGIPQVVEANSNQPRDTFAILASEPLPAGKADLEFSMVYAPDGGSGVLTISNSGKQIAQGKIVNPIRRISLAETFDIGMDTGSPVADYAGTSEFSGTLNRVDVLIGPARAN